MREPGMMRSKYAQADTETYVEMVFDYGGKVYTVRRNPEYLRPSLRGGGLTTEKAWATLTYPDGRIVEKTKGVDAAIEEIMGITRAQFTQIAMIAQGEFRKLLTATTEERRKIFQRLFQTAPYQQLQDKLKSQAYELKEQRRMLHMAVSQYIEGVLPKPEDEFEPMLKKVRESGMLPDDVMALFGQMIKRDEIEQETIERQAIQAEKRLDEITRRLGKAEADDKARRDAAAAEQRLLGLAPEMVKTQAAWEAQKQKQPEIEKLAGEIEIAKNGLSAYDQLEKLTGQIAATGMDAAKLQADIAAKETLLVNRQRDMEAYRAELHGLHQAGVQLERYSAQNTELLRSLHAAEELAKSWDAYIGLKRSLDQAQRVYEQKRSKAMAAKQEHDGKRQALLDGQAGFFASRLKEGEPCPVCGSCAHPHPALRVHGMPTVAEVKQAQQAADAAMEDQEKASEAAVKLNGQAGQLKEGIAVQAKPLLGGCPFEEISVRLLELKQNTAEAVAELVKRIQEEERKAQRKKVLDDSLPRLENQIKETNDLLGTLKQSLSAKIAGQAELTKQREAIIGRLSFDTRDKAIASIRNMESRRQAMVKEFDASKSALDACERELAALRTQIDTLKAQLQNAQGADTASLTEEKCNLEQEKNRLAKAGQLIATRLDNNRRMLAGIKSKSKELDMVESRWKWISALSDTANGTTRGKGKIMLETYIQWSYFDRILQRANLRLMVMTNGQYELVRRPEPENNMSQAGLDVDVIDHSNGSQRSVKSLSGGESFMAALSLALGLSDEIQSNAGGIRLDTMFVDEGFGSLD